MLSRDCFLKLSILPMPNFDWLYCLPLSSAALTPIGPPPAEAPPHELGTSLRAPRRERGACSGLGEAVAEKEEEKRRSGASRRQRRRRGWGDGAGARGRRGAAGLRGAWSGVRSAAASLPAAGGRAGRC